jgi:hypothetical protein
VDATHVYWLDQGIIWRTPKAGAGTTPLGDGGATAGGASMIIDTQATTNEFVVDADSVYWTNHTYGGLYRAPKSGGGSIQTVSTGLNSYALVADDRDVYFVDYFGGVVRYHKADGTTTTIAAVGARHAGQIAADTSHVYVVAFGAAGQGGSGIVRIAK